MQTAGRGHAPRRAVAPGPRAAQPPVWAEMLIEPGVSVGGGDPFRLAPFKERADQRRAVPELLKPPGAGVGHVDPRRREQRLHLGGAAQVASGPVGRVPQHPRVPRRPDGRGVGGPARPRPDDLGEQAFHRRQADRKPVRRQFRAQQLRGRFRASGTDPAYLPLPFQAGKLQPGGLKRRGRPEHRRVRRIPGRAKQVRLARDRGYLVGLLPVQASPHVPGLRRHPPNSSRCTAATSQQVASRTPAATSPCASCCDQTAHRGRIFSSAIPTSETDASHSPPPAATLTAPPLPTTSPTRSPCLTPASTSTVTRSLTRQLSPTSST